MQELPETGCGDRERISEMIGKILIVIAACIAALLGCITCISFGISILRDDDYKWAGIGFCVLGVVILALVTGMFLIGLEKGF